MIIRMKKTIQTRRITAAVLPPFLWFPSFLFISSTFWRTHFHSFVIFPFTITATCNSSLKYRQLSLFALKSRYSVTKWRWLLRKQRKNWKTCLRNFTSLKDSHKINTSEAFNKIFLFDFSFASLSRDAWILLFNLLNLDWIDFTLVLTLCLDDNSLKSWRWYPSLLFSLSPNENFFFKR